MEVVFIRHTSVDVPRGVCYGQTDVPLAGSFPEEAEAVKEKLGAYGAFDMVFTSPLTRCSRLAAYCGYPDAVRDRRLMELDFGDWEMQAFSSISDPRLDAWFEDYINRPAGGGESFRMQYARFCDFMDDLLRQPYRRVAVFTHGGILISAEVYAGLYPIEEAFSSQYPYGWVLPMTF